MADQIQNTQRALGAAHAMIESASPATLSNATPCEGWDARALIEHMIGVVQNFGAAFGGAPLTPPTSQGTAGLAGDSPAASYKQAADALMQAIRKPGALDQTIKLPFGEMPGNQAINIVIGDQSIHTWDLARATGLDEGLDPDDVKASLAAMEAMEAEFGEMMRQSGAFGAKVDVPAGADDQTRLLHFLGRKV